MLIFLLVQYCVITFGGDFLAQFEANACVSFDANRDSFLNIKWDVSEILSVFFL